MDNIIQIKTEKATILVVNLPDGATDIIVCKLDDYDPDDYLYLNWNDRNFNKLPSGNWEILGKAWELSEEQCKLIVPTAIYGRHGRGVGFKYFGTRLDIKYVYYAKDSFNSLLSKYAIYKTNPCGEKPAETFNHPNWEYTRELWRQAEERTWPNALVLVNTSS